MTEIQEAIWFFTDGFSPAGSHTDALAMIAGAQANPSYMPGTGDILAVICYNAQGAPHVQNTVIELRMPSRGEGLSPGYWKHNVNVYNGGHGSYSGDPHITPAQLEVYASYIRATFEPSFSLAWAQVRFQDNQYKDQWLEIANWFNAAAGLSLYSD